MNAQDGGRATDPRTGQHDTAAIGQRFRQARLAAGMSQEELAAASGVSVRSISDLEQGITRVPRTSSLALLAKALGFAPAERKEFAEAAAPFRQIPPRPPLVTVAPPAEESPILGRDHEIAMVMDALTGGTRLVTLVGIGGIGKTRIAQEIAERRLAARAGRVAWIPLADVSDPAAVLPAIAQALGLEPSAGTVDALAAALKDRPVLLALDNLEHLMDAAASIGALARACPDLSILVTSREALRIGGERVIVIDPLPIPEVGEGADAMAANPAIALYLRGLEAGAPAPAMIDAARIVRLLDGLPLAIEIAAAQTATMSPATIAEVLERAGLAALVAGRRDGPARFRTMEAALAWSSDLLPLPAVQLLSLLGAFRGGFTVESVAGVAGTLGAPELLDWLPMLTNVHLVRRQPGAEGRYTMLEPVRMFALDRLREAGALDAARQAHARWFTRWALAQAEIIAGPDPLPALDAFDADHANVRLAIETASAIGDADNAILAATGFFRYCEQRGHLELGRVALSAAIAAAGVHPTPTPALMTALSQAAYIAELQRRFEDGDATRERLAQLAEAGGSAEFAATAVMLAAVRALIEPGGGERAVALLHQARDIAPRDTYSLSYWNATSLLGNHLHELDDPAGALPYLEEGVEILSRRDCALDKPVTLSRLGFALIALGRVEEAIVPLREAAAITRRLGIGNTAIFPLLGLGHAAALAGDPDSLARAMIIFGFTDAQIRRSGETGSEYLYTPFWDGVVAESRAVAVETLGADRVQDLTDEGNMLPLDAVLELVAG